MEFFNIDPELILAGAMMMALTFYCLMAGADYGGGFWDLFSFGTRQEEQRELIASAIGPIWESNHVWLILIIVIMFTAYPPVYAALTTYLHIPLSLMLVGIVLRGSTFTFRHYDDQNDLRKRQWGRIFSSSSIVTPVLLGIVTGAISTGKFPAFPLPMSAKQNFWQLFVAPWLSPFPIAVGFFALALFAFLAAVYLTLETDNKQLQDDFRLRALIAGFIVALMALLVFLLSGIYAPDIYHSLASSRWTWPLHFTTGLCAVAAFYALWLRKFEIARICAAGQLTLILWGWAFSQFPYLIRPDLTIFNACAPAETMHLLIAALCAGALLLFPSFYYLYTVFKGRPAFKP